MGDDERQDNQTILSLIEKKQLYCCQLLSRYESDLTFINNSA